MGSTEQATSVRVGDKGQEQEGDDGNERRVRAGSRRPGCLLGHLRYHMREDACYLRTGVKGCSKIRRVLAKPSLILDEMCRLHGKFASYFSSYKWP